jgi:hypothetical protein
MRTLFERITCDFEAREAAVRGQLQAVCAQAKLPELFQRFDKWAIVGGAVRDLLLSKQPAQCKLRIDFPDIDIAVDRPVFGRHFENFGTELFEGLRVHTNSFGGLKLESEFSGTVDVWSWESKKSRLAKSALRRRLNQVDFGINAVAYLWPDNELIIHPRWFDDLKGQLVEKLAEQSPKPQFQPTRACALAVKLAKLTHTRFELGKSIRADLRHLLGSGEKDLSIALDYLVEKITNKRWCEDSGSRFFAEFNAAFSRNHREADSSLRFLVTNKLRFCLPERKISRQKANVAKTASSLSPALFPIS